MNKTELFQELQKLTTDLTFFMGRLKECVEKLLSPPNATLCKGAPLVTTNISVDPDEHAETEDTQKDPLAHLRISAQSKYMIAAHDDGSVHYVQPGHSLPGEYRLQRVGQDYPEQVRVVCRDALSKTKPWRHVAMVPWWWSGYTFDDISNAANTIVKRCQTHIAFILDLKRDNDDRTRWVVMGPHQQKNYDYVRKHLIMTLGTSSQKKNYHPYPLHVAVPLEDMKGPYGHYVCHMTLPFDLSASLCDLPTAFDTIKATLPPNWILQELPTIGKYTWDNVHDMRVLQEAVGNVHPLQFGTGHRCARVIRDADACLLPEFKAVLKARAT